MKSKRAEIIKLYFEKKMRPVDIAKKLNITKSAITQVLKKDNRYLRIKKERKNINQRKHREKTKNYIRTKRKIVQFERSADDLILRNMHNQASRELSKPKRLSNMAYRNWNKSAYSYNVKKRRFEFKENELGRSFDVPKYIKVEV